jgi:hypothetical protein
MSTNPRGSSCFERQTTWSGGSGRSGWTNSSEKVKVSNPVESLEVVALGAEDLVVAGALNIHILAHCDTAYLACHGQTWPPQDLPCCVDENRLSISADRLST